MISGETPEDWRSEHRRSAPESLDRRSPDGCGPCLTALAAPRKGRALGGLGRGSEPRFGCAKIALEGEQRGVGAFTEASEPELLPYASESWFTQSGARIKLKRLQQAGLPDFKNWRFFTVTMATRSISPMAAYERGKDRLRRFLARLRAAFGCPFRWCWKLEFHDDGYAHWHLLVEYKKRIPQEFLPRVESWWGLGRVNVRRVKAKDIRYVFKYVAKGIEEVPAWVSNHKGRFRVFQASKCFYTKRRTRTPKKEEPRCCIVRVDLHTRLGYDGRKALLITSNHRCERRVRVVKLRTTFSALLVMRAHEAIRLGRQLGAPGAVNLNQHQALILEHEHKHYSGLACIPPNAATAA